MRLADITSTHRHVCIYLWYDNEYLGSSLDRWTDVTHEVGEIWSRCCCKYSVISLKTRDGHNRIVLKSLSESANFEYEYFFREFTNISVPCSDAVYTDGYRAVHTGLRWL